MNLFEITFFNQYIISPKTWMHKVKNNMKIFFFFCYLFLVPYFHYTYIILSIIFYAIIMINLKIFKQYSINIFFLILIFSFNTYISKIDIDDTLYCNVQISVPPKIQISHLFISFHKKYFDLYNMFHNLHYSFIIPEFILRATVIYIVYLLSLKILCLTTSYEDIVLYYLMNCPQTNNKIIQLIALNTILSSQFLVLVTNKINITMISIKLRNTKYSLNKNQYYYTLKELLKLMKYDIKRISSILYCREINDKNFIIKNIYDLSN